MKKLLSIVAAISLTATSASTLVSCSTTLLTNSFALSFDNNVNEIYNQLSFVWDKTQGKYVATGEVANASINEEEKSTSIENSITGTLTNKNLGAELIQNVLNTLFFNAATAITSSTRSLKAYQYVFSTQIDNIYVDGQPRTAKINESSKDSVKEYYSNYVDSGIGIASIFGLYNYWNASNYGNDYSTSVIPKLSSVEASGNRKAASVEQQMQYINELFTKSTNQAIRNVSFKQSSQFVDGKIEVFKPSSEEVFVNGYNTNWISQSESNYKSTDDYETNYKNYIGGTSLSLDPLSTTLISSVDSTTSSQIKNTNVSLKQVDDSKSIVQSESPGHIFTSDEKIEFQYNITKTDEKNTAITSDVLSKGYQMVKLEPLEMEITYNDNVKLNSGTNVESDYLGQDFVIDITVDGLYAYYQPIIGFVSNDSTDSLKDNTNLFIGWQLMGYQFNNDEIKGFDKDGKSLTNDFKPYDDSGLSLYKDPFKDMAITEFSVSESNN